MMSFTFILKTFFFYLCSRSQWYANYASNIQCLSCNNALLMIIDALLFIFLDFELSFSIMLHPHSLLLFVPCLFLSTWLPFTRFSLLLTLLACDFLFLFLTLFLTLPPALSLSLSLARRGHLSTPVIS